VPHRIDLKGATLLVRGGYRDIYQHPDNDDLLVKVVRPGVMSRHIATRPLWLRWYKQRRHAGQEKNVVREINEYLALRRRGQHELPFIQHFIDLVETDRGDGMVVRKVRGRDGKLARTVHNLVMHDGLSAETRDAMDRLRDDVVNHHIVFGDVNPANIVFAHDREHGDRLVIIDGLGDRLWLPVNASVPSINRLFSQRRFARAMEKLEAVDRRRLMKMRKPRRVAIG
jgi:hypothetical protein